MRVFGAKILYFDKNILIGDDPDSFTEIYFGISLAFGFLLCCLMPHDHDQLGLLTETIIYAVVYVLSFIFLVIAQFLLESHTKRITFWIGATALLVTTNTITFWITFVYYNNWKKMKLKKTAVKCFCTHNLKKYKNIFYSL